MSDLKLFMLFLGCTPPDRHVEQHDVFFGIASSLKELIPEIRQFWPEAAERIHIDAWREVHNVEGYALKISEKKSDDDRSTNQNPKLFFVNLGGYLENIFSEQHYIVLTAKENKASAFRTAKDTLFFKLNHFTGAESHIDDKYGVDVDDIHQIEDILSPDQKKKYKIELIPSEGATEDPIHLGYLKLGSIE